MLTLFSNPIISMLIGRRKKEKKGQNHRKQMKPLHNVWGITNMHASSSVGMAAPTKLTMLMKLQTLKFSMVLRYNCSFHSSYSFSACRFKVLVVCLKWIIYFPLFFPLHQIDIYIYLICFT